MSGLAGTGANLEEEIVALMPAVRRFAMRFERSATDADDLTQDTMLKALANVDQFRPGTNVKSWLFTIARNTYCTKYRIRQRYTLHADMEVAGSGQAVQSTQEWSLRTREVDKAISSLDADKRRVLLMAISGESYEDIAGACGCGLGTIKSRIARARAVVIAALGETTAAGAVAAR
ncbi:sigma-70 family RNA polymerase sigma factor [Rhizobium sp. 1AS11]|uniref:sigma-70 family RNA polymerase sigma factor n=1 Tax=Rhizobium acaciae TaxID=2989736 RepID=UPI0022226813|nr:sigma-70 family RNA polymerase sigma factor [Rhizobium acaciae]MCW1411931.1 sigma-70 family RNA polymerase sigma factor [Rhizobium acaciae]MCW1744081.1 sigma-70 family RNA polymerase sigma factor [Rhizobium acaciae]